MKEGKNDSDEETVQVTLVPPTAALLALKDPL
jgi:hypothetical protein